MEKIKALLASWSRSFIAGALAVYMATGTTDLKTLGLAGIAALAPVLMRWANPNDAAFGISK
jgi:hypothetical protein